MNVHSIFLFQGKLRAIWRFLLSALAMVVAVIAVQIVLGYALKLAGIKPDFLLANSLSAFASLPALLGVVALFTRALERKPAASAGMSLGGRWKAELALGLALGAVMILAVAFGEWALGAAKFSWSGATPATLGRWGGGILMVLAFAATNEEIVFRGYPFQRLVESIGAPVAIMILSLLFGGIHLGNPNSTWVGALNTALVGIPFSIAYLRTRMLWLPIGMHLSWNFVQGFVLGLPVSGMSLPNSVLRAEVTGSEIVTGGAYGPEAGLLATAVILLATSYLAGSKSIYVSEATRALVSQPAAKSAPETIGLNLDAPGPAGRDTMSS